MTPELPPLTATTSGGPEFPASAQSRAKELPEAPDGGKLRGLRLLDWSADPDGNAVKLDTVKLGDRTRVAVELSAGRKEYTAIRCEGGWSLKNGDDDQTSVYIFNDTTAPLRVSAAFSMGDDFAWFESPTQELKPGWNKLEYAQGAGSFKARAVKWHYAAALPAAECRAVNLVIYNAGRSGQLFFDGVGIAGEASRNGGRKK